LLRKIALPAGKKSHLSGALWLWKQLLISHILHWGND